MFKSLLFVGLATVGFASLSVAAEPAEKTIVETAMGAGSFDTLVAAVKKADLVETLSGKGPFTVFAPTDDAFAALPDGTLDTLLMDKNKAKLAEILTYHVVSGKVPASKVVKLTSADTVAGKPVTIMVENDTVMLNGTVKVTKTDIMCSNGIIHVIDAVLLPPAGK